MATVVDVRKSVSFLPESTIEETVYRANGKGMARTYLERIDPKKGRVPNPKMLTVLVDSFEEKEAMLAIEPDKFFTTNAV